MPYFTITDFAAGTDLRRSSYTAPAGTLRMMKNCHVSPGGEIEKRMKFTKVADAPANSKGLAVVTNGLYVFQPGGTLITPGDGSPPYVAPIPPASAWALGTLGLNTATLHDIIDWDIYQNRVFVAAWTLPDGTNKRFYHGAEAMSSQGYYVRTYQSKVYTVAGSYLYFCKTGDPTNWTDSANGAGSIELSAVDSDMDNGIALEAYYDKLAVVGTDATQLWKTDPVPAQNQIDQTLRQAGTIAWRSVLQYGSGDILYLAPDGVRSLRARNSSLAAAVSDIGSPLDPLFQELYRTYGEGWLSYTIAILQPVAGRFWMILPDRIYVLSSFPGPKINAWSMYTPSIVTGTNADGSPIERTLRITHAVQYRNKIVVRTLGDPAGQPDEIYVYGDMNDSVADLATLYDRSRVELIFPYHAGEDPATMKVYEGIDAAAEGDWDVYMSIQPGAPGSLTDPEDYLGRINGSTFEEQRFKIEGRSTHLSLRLRSDTNGPKKLSNLIMHYQKAGSD